MGIPSIMASMQVESADRKKSLQGYIDYID